MLEIINMDEFHKWDGIITSFNSCDVYYLSGYTKALYLHGDGAPVLFYYNDSEIRAINVVMLRDIEKDESFSGRIAPNTLFDLSTPYGYGGFIIEGKPTLAAIEKLDESYSAYCNEKNIVSEFVRFHPVLNNGEVNHEC